MPIQFETAEYVSNEDLKGFENPDGLAKSYLELNGKVKTGALDLLPEELRNDPAIKPFKSLTDLGRSYVETKKMVGGFEKAPETPEGYKLTPMTNLHANVKQDQIAKTLLPVFHKAGVGPKMADAVSQGVLTVLSNMHATNEQKQAEAIKTNETALRQAWGGEYDVKMDKISQIMIQAGDKDAMGDVETIKKTLKSNPVFARMMDRLTSGLSEDSIKNLGEGADKPITDAKAAQEAIGKLRDEITTQGNAHPYWNESHAEHAAFMKKWKDLHTVAYPG